VEQQEAGAPGPPKQIVPFLKWAGGKRWIADRLVKLLSTGSGTYIEPFLGGGAVFFALQPAHAILSDSNPELINAYKALVADASRVHLLLRAHHRLHSVEYFYAMRAYKPRCEFRRAARFIYLNRTCWNGLFRVNLQGQFNVPIGTKTNVLMETDDWAAVASNLSNAEISCADFEVSIDRARTGDVVFADPPYTVKHNLNGFIKYNDALFSWADQVRLRDALMRAQERGARVVLTNANHRSVRDLYRKGFEFEAVSRASVLAAASKHRGQYEELLIRGL